MKLNDAQLGTPQILYKGTQAAIEALSGIAEGAIGYATDTNERGTYDGSTWTWQIHGLANKETIVDADEFPIADSAATYGLKHILWSLIKSTLKTYFDGIYSALGHTHSYISNVLTSAHILVGNGSNVATDVALSGDATIDNTGALTIAALAVTDAKVATANKDGTAATPSMRTLGTGATQAAAGNDSRFGSLASSSNIAFRRSWLGI